MLNRDLCDLCDLCLVCSYLSELEDTGDREKWESTWRAILNGSEAWAHGSHSDQEMLQKFVWPWAQQSVSFCLCLTVICGIQ